MVRPHCRVRASATGAATCSRFCRAEYGAVALWRGRWDDAEALLEASIEDFSRSRPAWVGAPIVALAELRRRQGRAAEAVRLLDQAGPRVSAQLCRARLALDRDEHARGHRPDRATAASATRAPASSIGCPRSSCSSRRGSPGASSTRRHAALDGAASDRAPGRHRRRCVPATSSPRAKLAAGGGDHERARTHRWRMRSIVSRQRRPLRGGQARIELAASLVALGRQRGGRA